jgi:muramoyltetrapeptide carboxypeptidase
MMPSSTNLHKPRPLKKGGTIGVFAPSSYVDKDTILDTKNKIETMGYNAKIHPQTYKKNHQSAGTHDQKIQAFYDLLHNPEIDAIIAAGGGNRALHLLDQIDFQIIADNPKIIMGFSDVTALLNACTAHANIITFHGATFPRLLTTTGTDFCWDLLAGKTDLSYPMDQGRVLKAGQAQGRLVGGNLCLFHYLAGTKDAPNFENALLFIEDIREETSRIDRMMCHLRRTGFLNQIGGLICGNFAQIEDTGRPFGFTLDDIILEHTAHLDIPIIMDAPFGHADMLYPFPIGGMAEMRANKDAITLRLLESPVE